MAANLSTSQANTSAVSPKEETEEQEEDYDIPEELERVIGELPVPFASDKNLSAVQLRKLTLYFSRVSAGWIKG